MWLVEELGFPLAHDLKLVALQGDCALREKTTSAGGRYIPEANHRMTRCKCSTVQ
jgi:hypothetical protein